MQIRRKKLACFQRVLIIQATTFRNEIRTRASPLPATSVSLMAASSPVIYIIRIPCTNASESAGKKGEERKVDAEKLAFLGDGRKLRERDTQTYIYTHRKEEMYIYTLGMEAQLERERCQAAVCSKLFKQNDASRGI